MKTFKVWIFLLTALWLFLVAVPLPPSTWFSAPPSQPDAVVKVRIVSTTGPSILVVGGHSALRQMAGEDAPENLDTSALILENGGLLYAWPPYPGYHQVRYHLTGRIIGYKQATPEDLYGVVPIFEVETAQPVATAAQWMAATLEEESLDTFFMFLLLAPFLFLAPVAVVVLLVVYLWRKSRLMAPPTPMELPWWPGRDDPNPPSPR